ncbi:putative signal transducing protein [Vibrio sp. RC27]
MVVLTKFSFPLDANIAKANLESVGIPAFIADEHTINMQWLYSDAMGGVRLLVPEEHYDEALELIGEDFSNVVEPEEQDTNPSDLHEIKCCGECQSTNIKEYTKGKQSAFVVFLLLGFPLFFYQHGVKCEDCGSFKKHA